MRTRSEQTIPPEWLDELDLAKATLGGVEVERRAPAAVPGLAANEPMPGQGELRLATRGSGWTDLHGWFWLVAGVALTAGFAFTLL